MKTFKYAHCMIQEDNVYVSESPMSIHPLSDIPLCNVEINIDDNGVMEICGEQIQFGFTFERTKLSNMDDIPQDNEVKHFKGLKIFGFYLIKPYDYVTAGWYRIKERKNRRIILNKYRLIFIEK